MSKWLSTVNVGIQSKELLTWYRWISQHPIHAVGTRSIYVKIKNKKSLTITVLLSFFIACFYTGIQSSYPHCRRCFDGPLCSVPSWCLLAALVPAAAAAAVAVGELTFSSNLQSTHCMNFLFVLMRSIEHVFRKYIKSYLGSLVLKPHLDNTHCQPSLCSQCLSHLPDRVINYF